MLLKRVFPRKIFPKKYAELAARTRAPFGFAAAGVFLWLAEPTPASLAAGGPLALCGLGIRAWAAGHLRKNRRLTVSGPYAYVRNPLYLGTLTAGMGFAAAGARPALGVFLTVFFLALYLPVIEEEEAHLRKILEGYAEYAKRVPRIAPALRARYRSETPFSAALYRENREYEAALGFAAGMLALAWKAFSRLL